MTLSSHKGTLPKLLFFATALAVFPAFWGARMLFPAAARSERGTGPVTLPAEPDVPGGSGVPKESREKDIVYSVRKGETLSEIAYLYGVDFTKLALYNNLTNPDAIRPGQKLLIPSLKNADSIAVSNIKNARLAVVGSSREQAAEVRPLSIAVEKQTDGTSVTAHFTIRGAENQPLARYEWNLDRGYRSFRNETFFTYEKPGTYTISLAAWDAEGNTYASNKIWIDVPYAGTYRDADQQFITLNGIGQTFSVEGKVTGVLGYGVSSRSPITEAGEEQNGVRPYRALASGYYNLTVDKDGKVSHKYLFVSPVESRHADRADLNWYRTQFNTGTTSNCGPSCASMGLAWALGDYVPVSQVRQDVGWQSNGSTSLEELLYILRKRGADARLSPMAAPEDLFQLIDAGRIAIVLYSSGAVRPAGGDPAKDLFGRYYADDVGHYIIIKGYSVDKRYFVVYDPSPSDWASNSARYEDGISMLGRNRYYSVTELFGSLRRHDVVEIRR
jgi:LysM repeat protein